MWLQTLDESRTSGDKAVQEVWAVYDERPESSEVEHSLADAYPVAGGPLPLCGVLRLGRGRLEAYRVRLRGVKVAKVRPDMSDREEIGTVQLLTPLWLLCFGLEGG